MKLSPAYFGKMKVASYSGQEMEPPQKRIRSESTVRPATHMSVPEHNATPRESVLAADGRIYEYESAANPEMAKIPEMAERQEMAKIQEMAIVRYIHFCNCFGIN